MYKRLPNNKSYTDLLTIYICLTLTLDKLILTLVSFSLIYRLIMYLEIQKHL